MKVKLRESPLGSRVLAVQEEGTLLFDGRVPVAIFGISTFASILQATYQIHGEAASTSLYMFGFEMGKSFAKQFVEENYSVEEALSVLSDIDAMAGWGRYRVVELDHENKRAVIVMRNSFIADALKPSEKPVCDLLRGYFAGILSFLWKIDVRCEEIKCLARGDGECRFEIHP